MAKYLVIIVTTSNTQSKDTFEKVRNELLKRINNLCESKLNANLFKPINENMVFVISCYIDVLKMEPEEYDKLDELIRNIIMEYNVHLQHANKEEFNLPKELMGRVLINIENRSENMLNKLRKTLESSKNVTMRRTAILK